MSDPLDECLPEPSDGIALTPPDPAETLEPAAPEISSDYTTVVGRGFGKAVASEVIVAMLHLFGWPVTVLSAAERGRALVPPFLVPPLPDAPSGGPAALPPGFLSERLDGR